MSEMLFSNFFSGHLSILYQKQKQTQQQQQQQQTNKETKMQLH